VITKHKYVRHSALGIIVWPMTDDLWHRHVGRLMQDTAGGTLVSAGFADFNGEGGPHCYGESESLKLKSKPAEDTALLRKQLGFDE
jgi:hypothetical protein